MTGLRSCRLQEAHFLNLCAVKQIQIHFHIIPPYPKNRCRTKCSRKDGLSCTGKGTGSVKISSLLHLWNKEELTDVAATQLAKWFRFMCIYLHMLFWILKGWFTYFALTTVEPITPNGPCSIRWQCLICIFTIFVTILVIKTVSWNNKCLAAHSYDWLILQFSMVVPADTSMIHSKKTIPAPLFCFWYLQGVWDVFFFKESFCL